MPRTNNFKNVWLWLYTNKSLQRRKYYSLMELYDTFNSSDFNLEGISFTSFKIHINKLISLGPLPDQSHSLQSIKEPDKRNIYKYILVPKGSKISSNVRVSSRRSNKPFNDSKMIIASKKHEKSEYNPNINKHPTRANENQENPNIDKHPTRANENQENPNIDKTMATLSNNILQMKKMDLPRALSFFMGKERANEIEEETKNHEDNKSNMFYSALIEEHIEVQIERLKIADLSHDGWKNLVSDFDESDIFSDYEIYCYRLKAYYLSHLYQLSLQYYNDISNFNHIASLVVFQANKNRGYYDTFTSSKHLNVIVNPKTLLSWFRIYRESDHFPNCFKRKPAKDALPYFLASTPDVVSSITSYCKENIETLTAESLHSYLVEDCIPKLVTTIQQERSDPDYTSSDLMKEYHLKRLCPSTMYNWMTLLGFKYEPRKKTYYVDSHEHPDNVKYRREFIQCYFEYELRCYRWITITQLERDAMVKKGEILNDLGYKFEKAGSVFYEFHVDDHEIFQQKCQHLLYGGQLSVRFPPNAKPLIIFGQDECIFKQYLFTKGVWVLPDGQRQLIPKDEGLGVMLSSLCSREFGYGYEVTPEILAEVNKNRQFQHYSDKEAAISQHGTSLKPPLTSSPFVVELEYGAGHDGYWSYDLMVLQLEDCMDILKHSLPQFDILFLLDHSNGHDKMKPDGLNINKINARFGGSQPKMHNTQLTKECFGPYHNEQYQLQVGSIQCMVFNSSDLGPCYMNSEEREKYKLDINTGETKTKNLNKLELKKHLKEAGVSDPSGSKVELQSLCQSLNLPTTATVPVVKEGWLGKPKGAIQMLVERGWLNVHKLHLYTWKGKKSVKDQNAEVDPTGCNFSISQIMKLQPDFENEETLLQYHVGRLGALLDRTHKCHPELAGEGIEYLWALAKMFYRRSPIGEKKQKRILDC